MFLSYMGVAAMLIMWPGPFNNFSFPRPLKATYEIWIQLAKWFQRRSRLKLWTDDDAYTISSTTWSLWLRWAKNYETLDKAKKDLNSYCKNVCVLIYLTVSTFAPKSFTSSMNSSHTKDKKQIWPCHRKDKVSQRSSLELSCAESSKLSKKSYFLAFSHLCLAVKWSRPMSLFEQFQSW